MQDSRSAIPIEPAAGPPQERAPASARPRDTGRRVPTSVWLGAAFVVAYLVLYEIYTGATFHESEKAASVALDVFTLLPYLAPVVLIEAAARGRLRKAMLAVYLSVHALVDMAELTASGRLDYAFLRDNLREATSRAGAAMVVGVIATPVRLLVVVELALIALFIWRAREPRSVLSALGRRRRVAVVAGAATIFALAFAGRIPSRDSLTALGNSVVQYYGKNQRMAAARARTPGAYPLVHRDPVLAPVDGVVPAVTAAERPNVVVIMMESFSAYYVDKVAPDGQPYTPTMNGLIARGLSAPHFYGNSIQTCHGHFATLCSLAPSYRKKEAYIEPLALDCLPAILRQQGYTTSFYEGDESEYFDGIDKFGIRMGISDTHSAARRLLTPEEQSHVWGWGLQDDYFYAWALRNVIARKDPSRPFFIALAPVSNHYPFNEEPGRADMPGEPTPARAAYTASLRASDLRLARFFELLEEKGLAKNTLVVVTGDHSFPADEHGSHWNERGFYEESFRVPLAIVWPGHLPVRALDGAYSQIDIAPTILDLVGIHDDVPFVGRSVLAPGPRFVPLVQPYDGQYLGAVAWPWKYREHGKTGETRMIDLAADPTELRPLPTSAAPQDVVSRLRADVERIHLNQALLQSDQVWPDK